MLILPDALRHNIYLASPLLFIYTCIYVFIFIFIFFSIAVVYFAPVYMLVSPNIL